MLRRLTLAALALALGVWLSKQRPAAAAAQGGAHGRIREAGGDAQAMANRVDLNILVKSQAADNRLFEVAWLLSHPSWVRIGDTLLREIVPQGEERFGLVAGPPPFNPGDKIEVMLTLFSRSLTGGGPVQDDAVEFTLVAQ